MNKSLLLIVVLIKVQNCVQTIFNKLINESIRIYIMKQVNHAQP